MEAWMHPALISLTDEAATDSSVAGGKAAHLATLLRADLPIPEGWVIPARVFVEHLSANALDGPAWDVFAGDGDEARCSELRTAVLALCLDPALQRSLCRFPTSALVVRSSATVEDGSRGSYSGLFDSRLGVAPADLPDAVRQVWASVFAPDVETYHRQVAPGVALPEMAVLIMPLLPAQTSGVAFSADPTDGNPDLVCISLCRGLGTRIVDGAEGGSRYVLDAVSGDAVGHDIARQTAGDFVTPGGRVESAAVDEDVVLRPDQLSELARCVARIDALLQCRVDVEFAFTDQRLHILQARPLLGLPPYFPDHPSFSNPHVGCRHGSWYDPVTPLGLDLLARPIEHARIPQPPWPMEITAALDIHGRAFVVGGEDLPGVRDRGTDYLVEMEDWDDPEECFADRHHWTERAFDHVLPPIRTGCARLLSLAAADLARLDNTSLLRLFEEALDLEHQAYVFYHSSSWPTSNYPEMTETLLQYWLDLPRPPPGVYSTRGEQLAMEMIQGVPHLTHERDLEVQGIALGTTDLDGVISRWGYSYVVRDEQIYLERWRSWREDPAPLTKAVEIMRRPGALPPLEEALAAARVRARQILERTIGDLAKVDPDRCAKRARLLRACVRYGAAHFRFKDDRDLVWSHGQAALRWILMEVTRRLVDSGGLAHRDDVFLLHLDEVIGHMKGKDTPTFVLCSQVEERRREQARLARYTPNIHPQADSPAPEKDGVMIGIPTGSGVVEGRAHIVHEDTALEDVAGLQDGDVMVFLGEGKVGLTMYFSRIAGLAYSCGNGFCHEVNILRELGKPALVSIGPNAYAIEPGERLRLDARRGTLTRLDRRPPAPGLGAAHNLFG